MNLLELLSGRVLRDYCHVEWWEVGELARDVASKHAQFDVEALRTELEYFCANPSGIASPINHLTANDFESDAEARAWLVDVCERVFPPRSRVPLCDRFQPEPVSKTRGDRGK